MANYDFSTLSPHDFEILCRDLFSKELNQRFESFAPGRDGGIDLRCFITKRKEIIVQCKLQKTYSLLKSNLKNEKTKVDALSPHRYIIATSVDLTRANKNEIIKILKPHIKKVEDVFGRQDINQLIASYPSIERNHFKLWLSSTNILQRILNNGAYTMSEFVLSEITNRIKYYVQNQSFDHAFDLINKHRVVVVSGVPGIGKTTLAHLLIYNLLSQKAAQFFVISNSISEGFDLFNENENQIFFFDDFLGRNFLEGALRVNEDDKLIKFIERIRGSKNKILICTTREYILQQASNKYEKLNDTRFEINKLVLDISHYTQFVKAEILYNHLYFADLERNFIEKFVSEKIYVEIIGHRNYNPRLINFITNQLRGKTNFNKEVKDFIIGQLDNPEDIWLYAFNNDISKISQKLLWVLLSCGDPIFYDDLFNALTRFLNASGFSSQNFDEIEFRKCLKELNNSFLTFSLDLKGKTIIHFHNPGIVDFLIKYIVELSETQMLLIKTATFWNQLSSIFEFPQFSEKSIAPTDRIKPIVLNSEQIEIIRRKILEEYDTMQYSSLARIYRTHNEIYHKYAIDSEIDKLIEILKTVGSILDGELKSFIKYRAELITAKYFENTTPLIKTVQLLELCYSNGIILLNNSDLLFLIYTELSTIEELSYFTKLESLINDTFPEDLLFELKVKDTLMDIVLSEIDYIEYGEWESKVETLEEINGYFGLDVSNIIQSVISKFDHEVALDEDSAYERWKDRRDVGSNDNSIHDLYNSLLN